MYVVGREICLDVAFSSEKADNAVRPWKVGKGHKNKDK